MPKWAQTYHSGGRYYRAHRNSRGHGPCPAVSGSISCEATDEQVYSLVTSIELGPRWMEEVMSIVALKDKVEDAPWDDKNSVNGNKGSVFCSVFLPCFQLRGGS